MMKSLFLRFGVICALATVAFAPICKADVWDKKTKVSVTSAIEVPGAVLAPGTYIFKLVNATANRHIVQIMNEDENRTFSLTMTNPARRLIPTDKTVLTFYEARGDRPRAVRTWYYPGDVDGQEFIYGRDQARFIPISSNTQVDQSSSTTQAQLQTTETPAEPVKETVLPASEVPKPIEVEQTATQPATEEPSLLAQAQPPAQTNDQPKTEPAPAPASSSDQLPKTASDLPLIALSGLAALALAFALRRLDRASNQ
jgi:hypothetical protein